MNPNESNPNESEGLREDQVYKSKIGRNGERYDFLEQRREVVLSGSGAVVQKTWETESEYDCGHDSKRPRGGRCCEEGCYRDSCAECYTRCDICRAGLCLFHVRYIVTEAGQKLPVCWHCRGIHLRRRFWRRFWGVLLSPFVTLDETDR